MKSKNHSRGLFCCNRDVKTRQGMTGSGEDGGNGYPNGKECRHHERQPGGRIRQKGTSMLNIKFLHKYNQSGEIPKVNRKC